ncbi:MAG: hypothetical protein J0M29_20655 [Chitinophagales bacterium]|nr:hypothetical protein [Chitinophagales bacterium]
MRLFFLLFALVSFTLNSCIKDDAASNAQEVNASNKTEDRGDATLLVTGGSGGTELSCGWSDGYGSGQVPCEGDHCALTVMTINGSTHVGITCFNDDVPLHTDNYRLGN